MKVLVSDMADVLRAHVVEVCTALCNSTVERVLDSFQPLLQKYEKIVDAKIETLRKEMALSPSDLPSKVDGVPWNPDVASPVVGDDLDGHSHCPASLLDHVRMYPYAQLSGLKTAALNGCAGEVISYDQERNRCGVLLFGTRAAKAITSTKLRNYEYSADCQTWQGNFNLCAIPPCECSLHIAYMHQYVSI